MTDWLQKAQSSGLRGEVRETLLQLRARGTHLVLGLRDVLDEPGVLREEWERKRVHHALEEIYDEIWVFGLQDIFNPLEGAGVGRETSSKTLFTGYLRATLGNGAPPEALPFGEDPFILVTPGGGGDGVEMVDWVIRAYEARTKPLFPAFIVLGPFMEPDHQAAFIARAEQVRDLEVKRFTPSMEPLLEAATAVVGMGGYNTFCEILSFDKPALLVPRVVPRQEQMIRALRAQELGLVRVLGVDAYPRVGPMIEALSQLPQQPSPSSSGVSGLLDGLDVIGARVSDVLGEGNIAPRRALP